MNFPLGTSAAVVRAAPLLLVDLVTEQGVTRRTYLFCYRRGGAKAVAALLEDAVDVVRGQQAVPLKIGQVLGRRFTLLGVTGLTRMALAALDGAMWDALARAADLLLATFLGGELRSVPAYNSSGLGLMAPEAAVEEAEALLQRGFKGIKLRLGYSDLAGDLAVTRAVRARIPLLLRHRRASARTTERHRSKEIPARLVARRHIVLLAVQPRRLAQDSGRQSLKSAW